MTNSYCDVLGITPPTLAQLDGHAAASTWTRFLVALMAEGGPLSLAEAAVRFEAAGLGPRTEALRGLRRCRPGRTPVYCHGERYFLDPHHHEADLWAFRLGLRPAHGKATSLDEPATPGVDTWEARREAEGLTLAGMRRAILRGWPLTNPRALVVHDVDHDEATILLGDDVAGASERLDAYDVLAGEEIRPLLEGLGLPFASRRLHELRPPQKTISRGTRTAPLELTMARLLKSSCGITRAWKSAAQLDALAAKDRLEPLADALAAEARDLAALYQYGRLHGALRIRWRSLDEKLGVSWVNWDEWRIYEWIRKAVENDQPLAVLTTHDLGAPSSGENPPWEAATWCSVYSAPGYRNTLVSAKREIVHHEDVQRLRFALPGPWHAPLPPEAAGASTRVVGAGEPPAVDEPQRILRVRVELDLAGVAPAPWRLIELPAEANFWQLHLAIQDAMGWLDYHLHAFYLRDVVSEARVEVGLPLGEHFTDEVEPLAGWTTPVLRYLNPEQPQCDYTYDYGDDWHHRVRLVEIATRDANASYPRLVDGARACPPEDVGGPTGFEGFQEAIADPAHEEHASYLEWCGGAYDPAAFDPAAVRFDDPGRRWVLSFGVR